MEIWKPLPTPDYITRKYEISNTGKLRSAITKKLLFLVNNGYGYKRIVVQGDNKSWRKFIHIAVAELFIGPRPTLLHQVNHKDGNGLNNHVDNLEWVTPKENLIHARDVLKRTFGGDSKGIPVLFSKDDKTTSFESIRDACKKLKLHSRNVYRVLNGERKTCNGYKVQKSLTPS